MVRSLDPGRVATLEDASGISDGWSLDQTRGVPRSTDLLYYAPSRSSLGPYPSPRIRCFFALCFRSKWAMEG